MTLPEIASATAGTLDSTFLAGSRNVGGANNSIEDVVVQPDGKIIIIGDFTSYNGTPRNRIARLNPDGTLDTTFDPGTGPNNIVRTLALQPDGKILIGGFFTSYNGIFKSRIARLNPDGSLDTSFDTSQNGDISKITVQNDGKIIVGAAPILRLNSDGSLDETFGAANGIGNGADGDASAIITDSNGKILISGSFSSYDDIPRAGIARLNPDGTLDMTFDPGSGANNTVDTLALQSDGKILIGGTFTTYNGTPRARIARINPDGTLDTTFDPGTGVTTGIGTIQTQSILVSLDGKIIIGGNFASYNGTPRNRIAQLNPDGSLDSGFNPGTGLNGQVNTSIIQHTNGKILIAGVFSTYNGTPRNRIAQVNPDGSLDILFNQFIGATGSVLSLGIRPDEKILIGGSFTAYSDIPRNRIALINPDGTLDTTFDPGTGANGTVRRVHIESDEKIVISGEFTTYNDTPRGRIARLNPDGTLDTTFDPGTGANGIETRLVLQNDGKIIIIGDFTSYNGTPRNRIARLNPDGTLDTTFDPGIGPNGTVNSAVLQSDGKILIGGFFTSYNGTPRNRIARLNPDGTLDTAFDPGTGANNIITSVAIQNDGKILIGGFFTSYNGTPRARIARINPDGVLDTTFGPGTGVDSFVTTFRVQSDGKILIGGTFTSYNGTPRNRIARLNPDGVLDTTFDPGTGVEFGAVDVLQLLSDGKILIGGTFTSYNGTPRNRIARILSGLDTTAPILSGVTITSSNTSPSTAILGDTITLSYTSDDEITAQTVSIAEEEVTPVCIVATETTCTATLTVTDTIPALDGVVPFSISVTSAGGTTLTTSTTNNSSVQVNRSIAPAIISSGVILPSFLSQNTPPLPPELEPSSETTPQTTPSPDVPIPNQPLTPSTSASCFTPGLGIKRKYNDPQRVRALQQFLNTHLSLTVPLSGIFGPRTHDAVSYFQELYSDAILTPIGQTSATGYFGIMSAREANRIVGCQ